MTQQPSTSKKNQSTSRQPSPNPTAASHHKISSKERAHAYTVTLTQARTRMNPVARIFSRFIHLRVIEIASDFIGSTLARPNAILFGSLASLIATFSLYFAAKYFGYPLSGSESIAAFVLGWAVGIIVDYTHMLVRGGRT